MKILICIFLLSLISCNSKLNTSSNIRNYNYELNDMKDSLAFELCQIYGFDQGIRNPSLKFNKREIMLTIDTLNFNRVVAFVIMNGFPTQQLVGVNNIKKECVELAVPAVLLHNANRLVNEQYYFNLFYNEVKKKNIDPEYFAGILDKYYWVNSKNKKNRRVFYGSQFGKPCIQTKDATNKARIEIGLKPLEDDGFVDCEGEELDMPKERK